MTNTNWRNLARIGTLAGTALLMMAAKGSAPSWEVHVPGNRADLKAQVPAFSAMLDRSHRDDGGWCDANCVKPGLDFSSLKGRAGACEFAWQKMSDRATYSWSSEELGGGQRRLQLMDVDAKASAWLPERKEWVRSCSQLPAEQAACVVTKTGANVYFYNGAVRFRDTHESFLDGHELTALLDSFGCVNEHPDLSIWYMNTVYEPNVCRNLLVRKEEAYARAELKKSGISIPSSVDDPQGLFVELVEKSHTRKGSLNSRIAAARSCGEALHPQVLSCVETSWNDDKKLAACLASPKAAPAVGKLVDPTYAASVKEVVARLKGAKWTDAFVQTLECEVGSANCDKVKAGSLRAGTYAPSSS